MNLEKKWNYILLVLEIIIGCSLRIINGAMLREKNKSDYKLRSWFDSRKYYDNRERDSYYSIIPLIREQGQNLLKSIFLFFLIICIWTRILNEALTQKSGKAETNKRWGWLKIFCFAESSKYVHFSREINEVVLCLMEM